MSRPHPRRACSDVSAVGGPRLSRPHPRRACSDVSAAGGPRLSRPHPRRAAVPAPDYSQKSRAEGGPPGTSAPTTAPPPPVRCAIWPCSRRGGRDERDFTPERSEVKSRGATREGRACRGRLGARCHDWPRARSTRAALGAGRPNAPQPGQMAVTGGVQFIASVHTGAPSARTTWRTGERAASPPPPRTWAHAVRFQCVIKSNQGQNRDLREPYRLGNQTLRKTLRTEK